jgi:hypothetical protein
VGNNIRIKQDYKHGFVDTKIYPDEFHLLGYMRFTEEMKYGVGRIIESDGRTVYDHVLETMKDRDMRAIIEDCSDIIKEEFAKELKL